MEIKTDSTVINEHADYVDFELKELTVDLLVNEKVEIFVDGNKIKEYTCKYSNCSFKFQLQDKGDKRDATELDKINAKIALLLLEKAELEAKEP